MTRLVITLLVMATTHPLAAGEPDISALSDAIVNEANLLKSAAYRKSFHNEPSDKELVESLLRLKRLVANMEGQLGLSTVPAAPPIDFTQLGVTTPAKDGYGVHYTDTEFRKRQYRAIKIEHTSGSEYIRMREIKVVTARGRKLLFNAGGGKFYVGDTFEIELPEPVHIAEIAVHVQHHTDGLTLIGDPLPLPPALPTVVELGVTNGVKDGHASFFTEDPQRDLAVRKLLITHTGGDEYVRLYDLTLVNTDNHIININLPGGKVRQNRTLEIELPHPMYLKSVRMKVQHRTYGLIIGAVR